MDCLAISPPHLSHCLQAAWVNPSTAPSSIKGANGARVPVHRRVLHMAEVNSSAKIVRFGVFEANLQTGELRKNGVKVPLQGQPFQVCAILLEHSGKLVSREELRRQVWPEDTFVDFDHALNTAITKIRIALGDEADNPRFVETLPRRGYRFIAPVDKPIVETHTAGPDGAAIVAAPEQGQSSFWR